MDVETLLKKFKLNRAIYNYKWTRESLREEISHYKRNIERLYRTGIGNQTEFKTIVKQSMIDVLARRLNQLEKKRGSYVKRDEQRADRGD